MPEISPELAARIETLKASHAENPARFFMPLASALREAGDTGRAEELLRDNLKRHPGYLSAHVLLGRCLADRGAYAEARNEFQYVLSVDPQNLIALRTLGDMAASGGDPSEARRWYGELLAVDPMNAEARQALANLDAAPQAAAPAEEPAQPVSEHDAFGMVEIDPGVSHAADHPAAHAQPGAWGEISLDANAAPEAAPAESPDAFEPVDFGAVTPSSPPQEQGDEGFRGDLALDETPAEPAPDQPAEMFEPVDFGAVDLDAAAAEGVPLEPSPAAGGFDAWGSVDDGQSGVEAGAVEPLAAEDFYAAPGEPHDEHDEHGEVVTETIAELYARQGFPDRAADVYRELIARRGEEPALVRRLRELEAETAPSASAPVEAEGGFEPLDLPAEEQPAETTAEETSGAPSWLETIDAVVAGTSPSETAEDAGAGSDLPGFLPAGDIDLEPSEEEEEPEPAVAAAPPPGDAFADSFAHGFEGAERREWEAPRVEETEAVPELAGAAAFAATMEEAPSEPEPVAAAAEPAHAGHSISAYLSAILSWRPGAAPAAEAAPAPAVDEGVPPPERPWDEQTLGAAVEQPPMDEPWIAGGPAIADQPAGEGDEAWSAPAAAEEAAAEEPWAAPAEPAAEATAEAEPWAAPADEAVVDVPAEAEQWGLTPEQVPPGVEDTSAEAAAEEEEDLPWLSSGIEDEARPEAGTEPAAPPEAPAEEPMPWETPFELSPEVPAEAAEERPAPRQEPTVEPSGGFSFEDFFAERPAEPSPEAAPESAAEAAPAPESAPEPQAAAAPPPPAPAQPAAPAPQQPASEEDEDLESFQAWLQSLKR
ncbi:MAG TPA: tetratricopeptide repeat protein [Longimicrobium sp.]